MKHVDLEWLKRHRSDTSKLAEKQFFTIDSVALFLPSLAALGLLNKAITIPHTDTLYDMEQVVVSEKTIAYLIFIKCPYRRVYNNGMLLHARKTLDRKVHQSVELHNTLPHFQIVNSGDHNTTIFCRDVTSLPRT